MKETAKKRTRGMVAALFCALAAFSALASTCIVSLPAGDRDPHHSLTSSSVEVDAGAGSVAPLQSWLESRFATFGASPGIAITTMPLGLVFSIR